MSNVQIVISKKKKQLIVLRRGQSKPAFTCLAVHGGRGTTNGTRKISKWAWGAISSRYQPRTWFSYGATFKGWPSAGHAGQITKWGKRWNVKRESVDIGYIWYDAHWYKIWKDINPFGVVMADLSPGTIELHGTGKDEHGRDAFPNVTHGCVRTHNKDILKIKNLAPVGTEVRIED